MEWTKERDARLTALWNQADPVLSATLIGTMMGEITKNAVLGRAHRLKLPPRAVSLRPANPNKQPKRAPKVTIEMIPPKSRIVADTRTMEPAPRWHEAVDEPLPARVNRTERLPISIGAVGRARECQWIEGDGKPWHMCGAPSQDGYSWCPAHKAMAFFSRAVMA